MYVVRMLSLMSARLVRQVGLGRFRPGRFGSSRVVEPGSPGWPARITSVGPRALALGPDLAALSLSLYASLCPSFAQAPMSAARAWASRSCVCRRRGRACRWPCWWPCCWRRSSSQQCRLGCHAATLILFSLPLPSASRAPRRVSSFLCLLSSVPSAEEP